VLKTVEDSSHSRWKLARLAVAGLLAPAADGRTAAGLERMGLERAAGIRERFLRYLLLGAYARTRE